MTKDHFNILSEKYHQGLTKKQKELLFDIGELIDKFVENQDNLPIGATILFLGDKEFIWDGQVFTNL